MGFTDLGGLKDTIESVLDLKDSSSLVATGLKFSVPFGKKILRKFKAKDSSKWVESYVRFKQIEDKPYIETIDIYKKACDDYMEKFPARQGLSETGGRFRFPKLPEY